MTFRMPIFILFFLFTVSGVAQTPPEATSDLPIRVTKGRNLDTNLYGWSQDIEVEGDVFGDVGCLSGKVLVSGRIEGNLNVINGDVHLTRTAVVTGNIVCLGGNVTAEAGSTVSGRTLNYFKDHPAKSGSSRSLKGQVSAFFAKCLFLFLLIVGLFYAFPNQVSEASFQLSQDALRAFFIGFITLVALAFLLFISLLLMVVVIGLPLLLLISCIYLVMASFGVAVLFFRLAAILRAMSHEKISLLTALFLMTLLAMLAFQIPYLAGILIFAMITLGPGIVIDTRFGTNKQWFTRKKRYWAAS